MGGRFKIGQHILCRSGPCRSALSRPSGRCGGSRASCPSRATCSHAARLAVNNAASSPFDNPASGAAVCCSHPKTLNWKRQRMRGGHAWRKKREPLIQGQNLQEGIGRLRQPRSKLRSIHPDRSASHDSFNLMIEEKIGGGSILKGWFLAVSRKQSKK